VFRDVTEKRRIDEQLKRIQKLESIGILAGGIAHDFNNILTAILANVSLAKMSSDCAPDVLEILNDVERESLKAKHITNQLLIFAKEEEPVKKMVSIAELLKETTIFATRGTNIKCEFNIEKDLWSTEVDAAHINQVINNLAINAVQAMPDGGRIIVNAQNMRLESKNKFRLSAGDYVKIRFQDEGMGIPKEIRQNIFVPFFSTKAKGSGLGLAVSHKIIHNHGGRISVKSREGEGTEFIIYLPAQPDVKVTQKPDEGSLSGGKGKILLMDDDETIRKATGKLLNRLGYDIHSVTDGVQAIEIYRKEKHAGKPFDVVIMDLTIPGGMGGVEAIRELRKVDPDVKAVVSSGYSNDPVMSRYQEYGFVDIAKKPYKIDELIKVLNRVMHLNNLG
jgi:CheY-like chemotaxis protein